METALLLRVLYAVLIDYPGVSRERIEISKASGAIETALLLNIRVKNAVKSGKTHNRYYFGHIA